MILKVRDSGTGFDLEKIGSPLNNSNLLRASGRGIFLMKTLMDKVEFHFAKGETEVMMTLLLIK